MNVDRNELFRIFEPPRGGVERIRERMAGARGPGFHTGWRAVAAGAAIALLLVVIARFPHDELRRETTLSSDIYSAPQLDRLLGRESEPIELNVRINGEEANVVQLASSNARIRVYALRSGPRTD
jgi:hypothetical protein